MEAPDPFSVRLHKPLRQNMNAEINKVERVIGLDAHPDTFTAALLRGPTPAAAVTEKVFNKLPLGHLRSCKGALNLVVAAVARKLTVAVWYLMMGRWTTLEEIDRRLSQKIGKIITQVGPAGLKILSKTRKAFREQICQTLKSGRQYILDPDKKFAPKPKVEPTLTLAQEYGLRR